MKNACALVSCLMVAAAGALAAAQTPVKTEQPSLQGEWTYNAGASTAAPDLSQPPRNGNPRGGNRGGGGPLGGGGRGMGRRGGGGQNVLPPQTSGGAAGGPTTARLSEAMSELQTPPARLTITQTDQVVVITTNEGRTTRLAPNDKKVKDENTGVERKTKWDGAKLEEQITGLPGGDVQQVYALDDQVQHRLHIITTLPNRQDNKNPIVLDRVYDASQP